MSWAEGRDGGREGGARAGESMSVAESRSRKRWEPAAFAVALEEELDAQVLRLPRCCRKPSAVRCEDQRGKGRRRRRRMAEGVLPLCFFAAVYRQAGDRGKVVVVVVPGRMEMQQHFQKKLTHPAFLVLQA